MSQGGRASHARLLPSSHPPATVATFTAAHETTAPRGSRVDHTEVSAPTFRADETSLLGLILLNVLALLHRFALCSYDSLTRFRGVGFADTPYAGGVSNK